ncbi:alpha/beta hydrolase [Pleionea sediminis]|uniref:alpha/beta hydrolase n=1 Tax=Pleionea sediminis TaxID=2569479 RepID=UPI0011864CD9|nr:alpha/beta hydrolase [Pleionea sediminis]
MKKYLIAILLSLATLTCAYASSDRDWNVDVLGNGFEQSTLQLADDYEGSVVATLVRKLNPELSTKAVLYIHGYVDYFFQEEMAQRFIDAGYNFYALDLRKYGRSLREHQRPNMMKDVAEYEEEITKAIEIIRNEEGNTKLLLSAHSTGGLIAITYADKFKEDKPFDAIFLNSPFFDLNDSLIQVNQTFISNLAEAYGARFPYSESSMGLSDLYGKSVHQYYFGEWDFNLNWKPVEGFPLYAGWTAAVIRAQKNLQEGIDVGVPVLVMYSKGSIKKSTWDEGYLSNDGVLDVEDIDRISDVIGDHVTEIRIQGGMHDLVLSKEPVRKNVYDKLFTWLSAYIK